MSPKSVTSPVEAIVTYSIIFILPGVEPPPITPLTEEETPPTPVFAADKLPKSVASPALAIVI